MQIVCHNNDIILCSEPLTSDRRHISEVSLADFNKSTLLLKRFYSSHLELDRLH